MSIARVHYVEHARQNYAKVAKTDEEGQQVRVPVTSKRTGEQKKGRGGAPMTRRITVADKSRPIELKCGRDGTIINPGDPYRWFTVGFRSHYRQIRCMKSTCTPKNSELESSGPRAEIYGAQESAEADLSMATADSISDASEIEAIVEQVAEAFTSAAEQWREADEQFGGGGNTENGERADTAEGSADELSGWSTSGESEPDYEACENPLHSPVEERDEGDDDGPQIDRGDMECDECSTIRDQWFEALIEEAREAIDGVEVP